MPNKERYEKINKQEAQEYHKVWRMKNQLQLREYYRQYRINNLEKVKKLQRDWYVKKKGIIHKPVIEYKKVVIDFD